MRRTRFITAILAGLAVFAIAPPKAMAVDGEVARTFDRSGVHFQVAFGWGGGPTANGLFHNMELGGTFRNGWSLSYNHVFIQSKGFYQPNNAPDLIGGHLLELKAPLFTERLVFKIAAGPGGTHDQTEGIKAYWGFAWAYGADLDFAIFPTSGLTLGFTGLHIVNEHNGHHAGWALSLGYTWF